MFKWNVVVTKQENIFNLDRVSWPGDRDSGRGEENSGQYCDCECQPGRIWGYRFVVHLFNTVLWVRAWIREDRGGGQVCRYKNSLTLYRDCDGEPRRVGRNRFVVHLFDTVLWLWAWTREDQGGQVCSSSLFYCTVIVRVNQGGSGGTGL